MTSKKTDNEEVESEKEMLEHSESQELWNEIWKQLEVAPGTKKDDPWQKAVEEIKKEDSQKTIEGHRFQGQGQ